MVRLSRKLIPGYRSYKFRGISCRDLGIKIEGEASCGGEMLLLATAKLFDILLKKDEAGTISRSKEVDALYSRSKKNVVPPLAQNLPEQTGVYYLHDSEGNVIYIGKSLNIRQRVITHLSLM